MDSARSTHLAVWWDSRNGIPNWEIYYKRSTDTGASWGTDTPLTNNPYSSQHPSVSVSGSDVYVVWTDTRDGNMETYFKRSTDNGVNWGADTRLTNNSAISDFPSVSVSGSVVHVVWKDTVTGTMRYTTNAQPTILAPVSSEQFSVPFNPSTVVQFSLPRSESVTLKVFSILGEEIATLVSNGLSAGTYQVDWNAQGFPSGIYFYRLQAGAFIQTRKLILLR